jgi:hypothetical protein
MLTIGKAPEAVRVVLREAQGKDPEAFVLLDPITPKLRRRALRVASREMVAAGVDKFADLNPEQQRDVGDLVSFELIRLGAREWGGIGDESGQPVALTPDQATRLRTATDLDRPTGTIDALLHDEVEFAKLDAGYVMPDSLRLAEKNASSGSPNGTSVAATPGKDTATCRAGSRKGRSAAKNAPTRKTRSTRTKAKRSGKS